MNDNVRWECVFVLSIYSNSERVYNIYLCLCTPFADVITPFLNSIEK